MPTTYANSADIEWAWFAGLFEGEGCIRFNHRNCVTLVIKMTDADVVRRAHAIAGVGKVAGPFPGNESHNKHFWRWTVCNAEGVKQVLDKIGFQLGERRSERVAEARERLERVRQRGRCKRGHRLAGENLYESPGGQRHCQACRRKRESERVYS